jgi:hypothetical protein
MVCLRTSPKFSFDVHKLVQDYFHVSIMWCSDTDWLVVQNRKPGSRVWVPTQAICQWSIEKILDGRISHYQNLSIVSEPSCGTVSSQLRHPWGQNQKKITLSLIPFTSFTSSLQGGLERRVRDVMKMGITNELMLRMTASSEYT